MAESGVILPADSTGKAMRTETATTAFVTGSGGVVHQQVVSIGDPTTAANLATVGAEGGLWVVPRGGVRHSVLFTATALIPTTTETLVTLTKSVDAAATSTAATYTVTTGKTLRIQGISVSGFVSTATAANTRITLRAVASGTPTATSPLQWTGRLGITTGTVALQNALLPLMIDFGDGLEFPAPFGIALTAVSSTTTVHTVDIGMYGYEYP